MNVISLRPSMSSVLSDMFSGMARAVASWMATADKRDPSRNAYVSIYRDAYRR